MPVAVVVLYIKEPMELVEPVVAVLGVISTPKLQEQ
jgi:hypothetical protein